MESYAGCIELAIELLKDRGGSSRQAIKKFVSSRKDDAFEPISFNKV
jgi:hypothetical protein